MFKKQKLSIEFKIECSTFLYFEYSLIVYYNCIDIVIFIQLRLQAVSYHIAPNIKRYAWDNLASASVNAA